jgi:hypothetical protein
MADKKRSIINGGISGMTSVLITYPLEYLKTVNQISNDKIKITELIKRNGYKSFYRGIIPQLISINLRCSTRFFVFHNCNKITDSKIISGFLAGGLEGGLIMTPLEVIKTRSIEKSNSSWNIAKEIFKNKGIKDFYHGLYATTLRQSIFQGTSFPVFFYFNNLLKQKNYNKYKSSIYSGLTAGICSVLLSNPVDVIKSKKQSSNNRLNNLQVMIKIYFNQGFNGFYQGVSFRILRVAPSQAITYFCYYLLS